MLKPTGVPSNHEQLIDKLWLFHIAAGEPSMRDIALAIDALDDDQRKGTANHETVRRTMRALTLPQWESVEVIFLALCQLANVDPDDVEPDENDNSGYSGWEPPRSHREDLYRYYSLAKHNSVPVLPRTRDVKARMEAEAEAKKADVAARRSRMPDLSDDDPWGSAPPF
ncbi:hypothetical protein ACIBEH_32735 [Nocardia salmonicida]|uniref:hypothetical protein n=1 Tax=Nocardia salmonicida TaxID=53431 RepID=UPI00378AD361